MKTITIRSKTDPTKQFTENYFDNQSEAEQFLKLYIKPEVKVVSVETGRLVLESNNDQISYKIEEVLF